MSLFECACGNSFESAAGTRRFRCGTCHRIFDPRSLGWREPQEGIIVPEGRRLEGFDRPRVSFDVDWSYDGPDMDRIRWGRAPGGQEDKWLMYVRDSDLWCHRSGAGVLCYRATLAATGVRRVEVVRDMPDHAWQVRMFRFLIENQLIGLEVNPP